MTDLAVLGFSIEAGAAIAQLKTLDTALADTGKAGEAAAAKVKTATGEMGGAMRRGLSANTEERARQAIIERRDMQEQVLRWRAAATEKLSILQQSSAAEAAIHAAAKHAAIQEIIPATDLALTDSAYAAALEAQNASIRANKLARVERMTVIESESAVITNASQISLSALKTEALITDFMKKNNLSRAEAVSSLTAYDGAMSRNIVAHEAALAAEQATANMFSTVSKDAWKAQSDYEKYVISMQLGSAKIAEADAKQIQGMGVKQTAAEIINANTAASATKAQQATIDSYDKVGAKIRTLQADLAVLQSAGNVPGAASAINAINLELKALGNTNVQVRGLSLSVREFFVMIREISRGDMTRLAGSFSIFSNATGLLAKMLTPVGLMLTATAGAALAFGAALVAGAKEQENMNKALALTNNFAGQSATSMRAIAEEVSRTSHITDGAAKTMATAFAASGQIGTGAFENVMKATAQYSRVSGETAAKATGYMLKIFSDPTKGAEELNKTMHFLSSVELDRIHVLQLTGHETEANNLLADLTNKHLESQKIVLSNATRAWEEIKNAASNAWNAMKVVAQGSDLEDRIKNAQKSLERAWAGGTDSGWFGKGNKESVDLYRNALVAAFAEQEKLSTGVATQAAKDEKNAYDNETMAIARNGSELQRMYELRLKYARETGASANDLLKIAPPTDAAIRAEAAQKARVELDKNTNTLLAAQAKEAFAIERNDLKNHLEIMSSLRDNEKISHEAWLRDKLAATAAFDEKEIASLDAELNALVKQGKSKYAEATAIAGQIAKKNDDIYTAQLLASGEMDKARNQDAKKQMDDIIKPLDVEIAKREELRAVIKEQQSGGGVTTEIARIRDVALAKEESATIRSSIESLKTLKASHAEYSDEIDLVIAKRGKQAADLDAVQNKQIDDWNKAVKDAFMSMDKGWQAFIDKARLTLKDGLLSYIYENFIKNPIVIPLLTTVSGTGTAGAAGLGGGGGAAGTGGGGVGGWMAAGKSLWDTASQGIGGGFTAASSTIGTTLSNLGLVSQEFGTGMGLAVSEAKAAVAAYTELAASAQAAGDTALAAQYANSAAGLQSGAAAGGLTSTLGAAGAGIGIGSMIGGNKTVIGLDATSASAIGAGIGAFWGPPGAFLGGVAGGLIDAMFGSGPMQYGPSKIQGSFSKKGFAGQNAQSWSQEGGWFGGGGSGTNYSALSQGQQSMLNGIVGTSTQLFNSLIFNVGEAQRSTSKWVYSINQAITSQSDLTAVTQDAAGSMGRQLAPELVAFTRAGETTYEAMVRLNDTFRITNQIATLAGKDMTMAFGSVGFASAAARDQLVTLMGGNTAASSAMQTFYTTFYTDTQRRQLQMASLTKSINDLGITAIPQTNEQFKQLVNSQNLATNSGQLMYASLIALSPAFNEVTKLTNSLAASLGSASVELYATKVAFDIYSGQTVAGSAPPPGMYSSPAYGTPAAMAVTPAGNAADTVQAVNVLRAELNAGMISLAKFTSETATLLRRWNLNGMPPTAIV